MVAMTPAPDSAAGTAMAAVDLHCRRIGSGPDLVLLHGWGLHAGIWEPVIDNLAAHYRLHLYDLPGHGHSAPVERFSQDSACAALARHAPARANWLGWSLGGTLALDFAARHPERVARLALLACNPKFVTAADWPQALAPDVLEGFAAALTADYAATLNRFLGLVARGAPDHAVLRTLRQALRAAPAPTAGALRSGLEILRTADLRAAAAALPLPLLWLAGTRDTLVPVAALRGLVAAHPQQRLHEFARAGHAPFISHPDAFSAAVKDFLQ